MYIPCIPCISFDSEISFATNFTFTKAINSPCLGLFAALLRGGRERKRMNDAE